MFEDYQICPYTGLRSFTEEESLYFKGREEHIDQATEQLQRNKFLMLTGASGDGKSSLVYAGIVPNAKAGFLKSKYTQWGVADFRPERTPFKNLCRAVARQLDIENVNIVESELHHGFSALVDLYKNSKCYVDIESVAWQNSDESQRAALKRTASNLIIIVDQFEEFFTNPENYHHGVPSRHSNLVLNLLLETSRIALEEDLPLYIVFTMRSDYIGQCAAFRSLPEYIGFSQFFVPRLNRAQLQQVIEEPATLSGNKITRRLTERLIHDISEGVDQLPILQHALNQIWHAADQGKEEMDLIHYAMVGGMPARELPDSHTEKFNKWFSRLPEKIRQFYNDSNLQNVLDTHANKLYESAAESYRTKTGKILSDEAAKLIVKTAFTCLTKIDQSRAVRNRMTLKEIQSILNRNDIDVGTISELLDIFRESGNTFIRPFITDEPETAKLGEDAVLDITHESLIRNWELLEQWAKEEFDNYAVSLDFEQQLSRWVESEKSDGFLLSIGPLTYFENWYNRVLPNAYWIARYLPEDISQKKKLGKARQVLDNAREFLKRSGRKHMVTRAIVKYGPKRMAAVLAVLGLLVLSSFGVRNYFRQQNTYVLEKIKNESIQLASNKKVPLEDKSILLCENLRLGLITIPEIAQGIDDPVERINAIAGMATAMVAQGWREPEKEIYESLSMADSLLSVIPVSLNTQKYPEVLREINELMATLNIGCYFNPSDKLENLRKRNARRTADWLMLLGKEKPEGFSDIRNFDMAIEQAINNKALTTDEIDQLIHLLSPFEKQESDSWNKEKFSRDLYMERGWLSYGLAFNGLYQELAYLYAASGNAEKTLMCLDTLMKYNQKYFLNDYSTMPDHAAHIAATFYLYGQTEPMNDFVKGYCVRKKISGAEFYKILVAHNKADLWIIGRYNYLTFLNRFTNLILLLADENQQTFFYRKYRTSIQADLQTNDERNFYMALSYKDQGITTSVLAGHGNVKEPQYVNTYFDSSFYFYRKVGKDLLDKQVPMYYNNEPYPLKYLFLYPDLNTQSFPAEPRVGYIYYSTTRFMVYILDHNLFDILYPDEEQLTYVSDWFIEARPLIGNSRVPITIPFNFSSLEKLEKKIRVRRTANQTFDDLYLILGRDVARTNLDSAVWYYKQIDVAKVANLTNSNGGYGMLFTGIAIANLAKAGEMNLAYKFLDVFKKPVNRASLYGFAAQQILIKSGSSEVSDQLIDSARAEMLRVENTGVDQPSRFQVPFALALRLHEGDDDEAEKIFKNVGLKFFTQQRMSRSFAFHGNLYEAYDYIPATVSSPDKATFLWNILYGYALGNDTVSESWKAFENNYRWWYVRFINYDNESN